MAVNHSTFIANANPDFHHGLLEEVKRHAAERWVSAVNADGKCGRWLYRLTKKTTEVSGIITAASGESGGGIHRAGE
jgi:hypothetical protein